MIAYGNDPLVEYELLKSVKFSTQMDVIVQLTKALGSPESYALQFKDSDIYIAEEVCIKICKFFASRKILVRKTIEKFKI
jgi:hypothetical protein